MTQNMQKQRNTFSIKIFILRKINDLVSTTFTSEQESTLSFKLKRNEDLTFIVIIIDID